MIQLDLDIKGGFKKTLYTKELIMIASAWVIFTTVVFLAGAGAAVAIGIGDPIFLECDCEEIVLENGGEPR